MYVSIGDILKIDSGNFKVSGLNNYIDSAWESAVHDTGLMTYYNNVTGKSITINSNSGKVDITGNGNIMITGSKIVSRRTGKEVNVSNGVVVQDPNKTMSVIETTENKIETVVPVIENAVSLSKSELKQQSKETVKKKYKIGETLLLRGGIKDGSERLVKKFVVKQIIWTLKDKAVNILILKQIDGPNRNKYTLNKADCKRYHVKYETRLVVYPMELNFTKVKQK